MFEFRCLTSKFWDSGHCLATQFSAARLDLKRFTTSAAMVSPVEFWVIFHTTHILVKKLKLISNFILFSSLHFEILFLWFLYNSIIASKNEIVNEEY